MFLYFIYKKYIFFVFLIFKIYGYFNCNMQLIFGYLCVVDLFYLMELFLKIVNKNVFFFQNCDV